MYLLQNAKWLDIRSIQIQGYTGYQCQRTKETVRYRRDTGEIQAGRDGGTSQKYTRGEGLYCTCIPPVSQRILGIPCPARVRVVYVCIDLYSSSHFAAQMHCIPLYPTVSSCILILVVL